VKHFGRDGLQEVSPQLGVAQAFRYISS